PRSHQKMRAVRAIAPRSFFARSVSASLRFFLLIQLPNPQEVHGDNREQSHHGNGGCEHVFLLQFPEIGKCCVTSICHENTGRRSRTDFSIYQNPRHFEPPTKFPRRTKARGQKSEIETRTEVRCSDL